MSGRALLIGASRYGKDTGFIDLPADRDVELMRQTLRERNFEVEVADELTASNATLLDRKIAEFCANDDVGAKIVYLSGHGMSLGGQDWIIPAGVSREDAFNSANQRVPTDLSKRVAANDDGDIVLFIVDACRDEDQTGKGQSLWSKSATASGDRKFIRLFGCSALEACHVLRKGHDGEDISVFTKALSIALAPDSPVETLNQLWSAAIRECKRLAKEANPTLPVQNPSVNIAGDQATPDDDPLSQPVFGDRVSESLSFEPGKLNCLVIESEHASYDAGQSLSNRVSHAFANAGATIWKEFRSALSDVEFVNRSIRTLPTDYHPSLCVIDVQSVVEAFGSDESLEQAVLAAVKADLAFFDVSRFEPGVMFLLGVRASSRRGVTLCSYGCGWHEGEPLNKPFNLSDLQIFSHSQISNLDPDPVVQRLLEAIKSGFRQLKRQPRYQDLPAYDALRELGPGAGASGTIPSHEYLLMLCSFHKDHLNGWLYVQRKFKEALQDRGVESPRVQRLIDSGSPQLVSQALYENIRRASACVMDWSYYSPSAFLELGVRLIVSPWGALQIIDDLFVPGGKLAPRIRPAGSPHDREWQTEDLPPGPELRQLGKMAKRFEPAPYHLGGKGSFKGLIDLLVQRQPFDENEPDYNRLHRLVQNEIGSVSPALPAVQDLMSRAADTLSDAEQDKRAAAQVLFSGNPDVKRDRERAALEYRISGWLYLEHRVGARSRPEGDRLREAHKKLGQVLAAALYETGRDDDFLLAQKIERLLNSEKDS
jgi:hypothetical protein